MFAPLDGGLIAVAKSLLESETIEYLVRFEGLQDLFGLGRWGMGFSLIVGPAEFWVREDDADRTRELLKDLVAPGSRDSSAPPDRE